MARPNVTVIINDESFFVPGTESGSSVRAGMPSFYNLIGAVGTTAERKSGLMESSNISNWVSRLKSNEPVGSTGSDMPFLHGDSYGNTYAGGTYARWPQGPTGDWENEWWAAHNYLQYGGTLIVAGTGSDSAFLSGSDALKDKQTPLDVAFAATGGNDTAIQGICTNREDCISVTTATADNSSVGNDEFNFSVFGQKKHLDIYRTANLTDGTIDYITTNCAADVAGCIARSDKLADPWWSPAGFKRGQILDVVSLVSNPDNSTQDTMYENKINPIVTFPGEGTVLFGDKTGAGETSTLSRINVSRLFIYLKKTIGAAARAKLFEFNDAQTRTSFVNSVTPVLDRIQARRGMYDFKVVCDDSNNPPAIADANQFVADIFIKPTKSINFIRITFTNKNTSDTL